MRGYTASFIITPIHMRHTPQDSQTSHLELSPLPSPLAIFWEPVNSTVFHGLARPLFYDMTLDK